MARILVVEDEAIVALDIRNSLQKLGHGVAAVAVSGEEAVRKAQELRPELVLMDIVLKGELDGVAAAEKIRRLDIPVVYLTAHADEPTLERAKATGPFGYLLKPFKERELHVSVEMALYKHRMESLVKERERWLGLTLRSIGSGVIATGGDGRVKFMNPVGEALTGWRREEAVGRELPEVFRAVSEEGRAPAENPAAAVLRTGGTVDLADHILIAREGTEIPVDCSAAPIRDGKGAPSGIILTFRDVSECKQAEERLRHYREHLEEMVEARTRELEKARNAAEAGSRAKSEFLAVMSHELRTPLSAILGFSELVLQGTAGELNWKQQKCLQSIHDSGRHLLALISDVLDLGRIEAGKMELEPAAVDVRGLIERTLPLFRDRARQQGIELGSEIEDGIGAARADERRLRQVLDNLLGNALKFTPGGGAVTVTARRAAGDFLEIAVADTGIGIPPELQERIFESFVQANSSSTRQYGGTGLGLAITRQLVGLMGGELGVESEPGQGSTFRFTVPMSSRPAPAPDPQAGRSEPRKSFDRRVLLAEDDPVNLEVARAMLENLGCRVEAVTDGRQAVEARARQSCDLIFMDVRMPVLDGFEATRTIREQERGGVHVPIIALTAHALKGDRERCLAAGMDDYLSKPFNLEQLRAVLERWGGKTRRVD